MGTRNLTMVISEGRTRIAQYGQWDGYPGGQGTTVLKFLRKADLKAFSYQLRNCKFVDDEKQKEIDSFLQSIGASDGWLNGDQSRMYRAKYPLFTRDHGANILQLVMDSEQNEIWLQDSSSFAGDSLMNEWSYVVDLDKGVLEVYKGFNKTPLQPEDRFFNVKRDKDDGEYHQIKIVKSFDLSALPETDEFIQACEPAEIEEE